MTNVGTAKKFLYYIENGMVCNAIWIKISKCICFGTQKRRVYRFIKLAIDGWIYL
jgi:DNA-binding XRE family transcriptional regulator